MKRKKIFVSAVSRELQSYRKLVDESLRKRCYDTEHQEIFNLTDQQIVDLLKEKLHDCDAVVCLVGEQYGAEPSGPLDDQPRRSFTQLEFFLARDRTDRSIPVYRFLTTPETPVDHPNDEPDDLRRLQQEYRALVTRDRDWRSFANSDVLRAEIAELRFPWEGPPPEWKPNNLPPSIGTLFKGRDEFLATLRTKLQAGAKAAATTPRHAIHGLGGVGKTRLAVEYGWRHIGDYTALLYLYAESPEALLTNLAQLTGVLELPERELREDQGRADAVLRWLNEHRDWLLLVDNVDSEVAAQAVTARLERLHGGHVVITSRLARWSELVEPLELDVLAEEHAVALLLEAAGNRARQADDSAQASLVARDVDGLALGLTQAAGYIGKYRISFADYRQRWQANVAKVSAWHDPRTMKYPRSLAVTWNTTVDLLTPAARMLLELLAFLAPEPMPRNLVTGDTSAKPMAHAGIDEPEEALVELADVSLIRLVGDTVVVHRLVQEITCLNVPAEEREVRLLALLLVVATYPLGDPTDVRTWPRWEPIEVHLAVLLERADAAGVAHPTSGLMNELGLFLSERVRFGEAERLYRRALAIDEASFGSDHPKVANRLNNLASLLHDTNRLSEAEPLMRRALAIDEASFGSDHPKVADHLNNLAQLLQATNRLSEAEPLMRRTLAIDEASFGSDHPNVAIRLNNLAGLLQATNRLSEAEPLMRRALAIDEASFGSDHPNVATNLNNLAGLLQETNRLSEAEPLMRRALAIDEASFGSDHPEVARDLNNLAQLLKATNRLSEAEPLMRRHLEIFTDFSRRTGHEHPHFRAAIENYVGLLIEIGRSEAEIEAALRAVLERVAD